MSFCNTLIRFFPTVCVVLRVLSRVLVNELLVPTKFECYVKFSKVLIHCNGTSIHVASVTVTVLKWNAVSWATLPLLLFTMAMGNNELEVVLSCRKSYCKIVQIHIARNAYLQDLTNQSQKNETLSLDNGCFFFSFCSLLPCPLWGSIVNRC